MPDNGEGNVAGSQGAYGIGMTIPQEETCGCNQSGIIGRVARIAWLLHEAVLLESEGYNG